MTLRQIKLAIFILVLLNTACAGKPEKPLSHTDSNSKSTLVFETVARDTLVYSIPGDSTMPSFSYHNSVLQAGGNSSLARWVNDEIKTFYQLDTRLTLQESTTAEMEDYIFDYTEMAADLREKGITATMDWQYEDKLHRTYHSNDFLILNKYGYSYSGGAHGNAWSLFISLDLRNRHRMRLSDIIAGKEEELAELLEKNMRKTYDIKDEESLQDFGLFELHIYPNDNFYFDDKGLSFLYNQYEIAPYAAGMIEFTLPWGDLKELLKPDFKERMLLSF